MVSKIFGNALIRNKIFMRISVEFYLLLMVGGFEVDENGRQCESTNLTTSVKHIC